MKHTKLSNRSGFTLMELLIVLAIIVALFALVLPGLLTAQKNAKIKSATIQIRQFEGYLEQFATENRGYPTTEQGLNALLYVPDNLINQPTTNPMMTPGGMSAPGTDPNSAFGGNAASVGPEMLGGQPGMAPMGGMPMDPMGGNPMGGMSGANPMDPMGGGMTGNPMDPMSGSQTMATSWNQVVFNPQLYLQRRPRSTPAFDASEVPLDPWGNQYRYDNNKQFLGLNRTGDSKPAVWSAGPDGIDETEDDIRNWEPKDAQQKLALRQQQGGVMGNPNPMDPMGGGQNPMDPMGGGMQNPNPMDPMGGGLQNPNPMNPMGGGMPNPMGGGVQNPNPMGPGGMNPMPNPMPTPMPNPNPMGPGGTLPTQPTGLPM